MTIELVVSRDWPTGGLQLSIQRRQKGEESTSGFRIGGPKFSGRGEDIRRFPIDSHTAEQIRSYLDEEFPTVLNG